MGDSTENNSHEKCWKCGGSFTATRPGLVSIGNLMTTHLDCIRDSFLARGWFLLENQQQYPAEHRTVGDEMCYLAAQFESLETRMNELEAEQALRNVAILELGTELDRRTDALAHSNRLGGQNPLQLGQTRALGDEMRSLSAQSESMETKLNEFQVDLTCIGTDLVNLRAKLPPILDSSTHCNRLVFGSSGIGSSPDDGDHGGRHENNEA